MKSKGVNKKIPQCAMSHETKVKNEIFLSIVCTQTLNHMFAHFFQTRSKPTFDRGTLEEYPGTTTYWQSSQREERLSRCRSLEQQHARDRHAAEAIEEKEESVSRHCGVQRQCQRDWRATTERGRLAHWLQPVPLAQNAKHYISIKTPYPICTCIKIYIIWGFLI